MASMNNWLGFSLSPQELPPHHHQSQISGNDVSSGECFDLSSDSNLPSLNLPSSFGILEAFNRNTQSQDWNMIMGGGTCNNGQNMENQGEGGPKLENFLGGNSFSNHETGHYMYQNLPSDAADATTGGGGGGGGAHMNPNSNIGLSMIKNWLRNQPTPTTTVQETKQDGTQSLSLSMSTESPVAGGGGGGGGESTSTDQNKQLSVVGADAQNGAIEAVPRKSIDTFGQRTSIYRGVTRHRWTGRYEAHLWDNSCRREGQTRKGRQVYLGGYDKEDKAARAYDLAALKYWGTTTTTNFPISTYEKEIEEMKNMTRQEYVASLRRKSSGFSRGASIYRGVTRHHQHGRWQARIGRVAGNKDLYLGTFSTQEEAAEAYDIAAIKFRGLNAVTNFDMNRYDVKSILESSTLPIGSAAKRLKDAEAAEMALSAQRTIDQESMTSHLTDAISSYGGGNPNWPTIAFHQAQPLSAIYYPYTAQQHQRYNNWCKQEQDVDNSQASTNFQDLNQLQLGNTHNFFQQHNLMSLDSASLEHSSGSNSAVYSSNGEGYNGYVMPLSTVIDSNNNSGGQGNGGFAENEMMYGGNNLYYQQQSVGVGGGSGGSACNNWVPTAVPTLAARAGNVGLCQGFSVWNDS